MDADTPHPAAPEPVISWPPTLTVDPRLDPFGDHQIPPEREAGLLLEIIVRGLRGGANAWQLRLDEVARVLTEHASSVVSRPILDGRTVRWADIGLIFTLAQAAFPSSVFSSPELHRALALWLLVQSEIAKREGREVDALRLVKACLWCLPMMFVENAEARLRRRRSSSACIGADVRHEFNRARRARLLSDFRNGSWSDKTTASEVLAKRCALSITTVRKLLQGA